MRYVCGEERFFWVGMMGVVLDVGLEGRGGGGGVGRKVGWRSEMVKEGVEGG